MPSIDIPSKSVCRGHHLIMKPPDVTSCASLREEASRRPERPQRASATRVDAPQGWNVRRTKECSDAFPMWHVCCEKAARSGGQPLAGTWDLRTREVGTHTSCRLLSWPTIRGPSQQQQMDQSALLVDSCPLCQAGRQCGQKQEERARKFATATSLRSLAPGVDASSRLLVFC